MLQAVQYSMPQSCNRIIVIAAASGKVLREFPKLLYTFPLSSPLFKIDNNILYDSDRKSWLTSSRKKQAAPYDHGE
jgi:hypothetical protein